MAETSKLGSPDSRLGNVQLAFTSVDDLRPFTGSRTGKLGTVNSLLGNMRPALGEQEGETTGASVFNATAESALSLSDAATVASARALSAVTTLDGLAATAVSTAVLALAASNAIAVTDASARNNPLSAEAQSTINLEATAGFAVARAVAAESILDLAVSADSSAVMSAAESSLSLEVAADYTIARAVAATSALGLAAAAGRNNLLSAVAESAISLEVTAARAMSLAVSASSELDLTVESTGAIFVPKLGDAHDFLFTLHDAADVVVVRSLSAQSILALSQAAPVGRPWYVSAESAVQTFTEEYDQQTDTFYQKYEGLKDSASVARPLEASARQAIPLQHSASAVRVKANAIDVSAESVLELLGEIRTNETGAAGDWLVLGQAATVDKCKPAKSALELTSAAAVFLNIPRGAASALNLGQAATYSIVSRGVLQQYHPFVGEGASGSPTPPAVTIEPPEHLALPFQLFYPAEGVVTDSVALRAPNLGNKDRLSFNRILRETRGGTLIVFADPIWPKIETLVLTFSGLRSIQAQQLLTFLETHLGEEIGLLNWEGRAWKGVVTTPSEPVVQDDRDSFSASLEFEGELVSA